MYKILTVPNTDKLCSEVNENKLKILKVEQVRGHLKALCVDGANANEFVMKLQGSNQDTLIDFINNREGDVEEIVFLAGGAAILIARFEKTKYEKLNKAEEKKLLEEAKRKEDEERKNKALKIKEEIDKLEQEKKKLSGEKERSK